MKRILAILQKKSTQDALIAIVYFIIVGFLKWRLTPAIPTLFFFIGGVLGIYLLDLAEDFFHLMPSPFRSVVFVAGLTLVSFFVITSTASLLGKGLVLSLSLTLLVWQVKEWRRIGHLNSWYVMISEPVTRDIQRLLLAGFIILFIVETYFFLR